MKKAREKRSASKTTPVSSADNVELAALMADIDNEIKGVQQHVVDNTPELQAAQDKIDIGRHICIELGGHQIAIPLEAIAEAGEHIQTQSLPLLPDWVIGITNIRGEIISVIDLNLFFSIKKNTQNRPYNTQIKNLPYLIVQNDDIKLAVTVDKITATRPLYTISDQIFKNTRKKDVLFKYFSGKAFYEKDNIQKDIFLFDLNKFFSSDSLYDFSIT